MGKTLAKPEDIRDLVEPVVAANQPEGFTAVVKTPWFDTQAETWIVPIDIDRDGVSALRFANFLVDWEESVAAQTTERISLHPAGCPRE